MSQELHQRFIIAALEQVEGDLLEPDSPKAKSYEFADDDKFQKYLLSDCIKEISDKCNAYFIDSFEEQWLYPDTLPVAIDILTKHINKKKNAVILDYLLQTRELMELALKNNTFFIFLF